MKSAVERACEFTARHGGRLTFESGPGAGHHLVALHYQPDIDRPDVITARARSVHDTAEDLVWQLFETALHAWGQWELKHSAKDRPERA